MIRYINFVYNNSFEISFNLIRNSSFGDYYVIEYQQYAAFLLVIFIKFQLYWLKSVPKEASSMTDYPTYSLYIINVPNF